MTDSSRIPSDIDVLLVDGDPVFSAGVRDALDACSGHPGDAARRFRLTVAATLEEAVAGIKDSHFDLVIANLNLSDGSGMDLLPVGGTGHFPVVLISDHPGERLAVDAIKAGAIDYFVKSAQELADLPEFIAMVLQEWDMMLAHQRMQLEVVKMPQREQQRLGQELHDGVGQQLTGLGMVARSLKKKLSNASPREQEIVDQLERGLEQALADVRHLSRGLFPVQMDAHGLVSALEELASTISRQSGIVVKLRYESPILITNNDTATHVYRIIQEAINNAVKHAHANEILLILEADENTAIVEVRDDGRGLPDDMHLRHGMGLHTMFHRCQLFGGSLDIYTHDEGGTRVRCCFSLHPEKRVS